MGKIVGISLCGVLLALVLKEQKPHLGVLLGTATAVLLFLAVLPYIGELYLFLKDLFHSVDTGQAFLATLMKITGIACLARIGSDVCRDAGFGAVATVVFLAGRVLCTSLCLPQVITLLSYITELLP